jgi:hypothetical protein
MDADPAFLTAVDLPEGPRSLASREIARRRDAEQQEPS